MSMFTDTQLILLSSASRRADGLVALPKNLQGGVAAKLVKPLLERGQLEEIAAAVDMPVWRRGQDGAQALHITKTGLAVIGVESAEHSEADEGGSASPKSADTNGRAGKPSAKSEPGAQAPRAQSPCADRE